jgi:hypothetical protein
MLEHLGNDNRRNIGASTQPFHLATESGWRGGWRWHTVDDQRHDLGLLRYTDQEALVKS